MQDQKQRYIQMGVMLGIMYVVILFVALHFLHLYNTDENGTAILTLIGDSLSYSFSNPFSMGHAFDDVAFAQKTIGGLTAIYAMFCAYYITSEMSKNHENSSTAKGSARFLKTKSDFKKFAEKYEMPKQSNDPKAADPNIILSKNVKYGLKQGKNTNVVIIGSAGSGKSFGIIKPNLMQLNSSYVITDPSGEIFHSLGNMLLNAGYNVRIFSTTNMAYSHCYNPFDYCYDEEGKIDETRVSTMITLFLSNATESKKQGGGDPFWEKSSKALLNACVLYLLEFRPETEHNMYQVLVMVQKGKVDENKSSSQTALDEMFEKARADRPEAKCFSSYDTFKLAPAKTANSILISVAVDLNMFDQDKVRNLTTTDYYVSVRSAETGQIIKYLEDNEGHYVRTDKNIDLKTIGDEKTAIFVMTPQANPTYNFLVTMFYSQLFEVLYGRGESICPQKFLVRGKSGYPVLSMINSKEDAEELIKLYKNARVEERPDENGDKVFYIYNREADKKFWIKGLDANGILKKVYSREVGENFLAEFSDCKVEHGSNRLPWHVQCLLDEFSNIGEIPDFPQKLATSRKYEISAMIVLQSLAQLKNRYDKLWGDVLSNCDTKVFLGTQDPDTCKWISELMGKRTIRVMNKSTSHAAKGGSDSTSYNLDARELAQQDEVARLDKKKCYVIVSGEFPIIDYKFMATDHPRWKETGDKNPEYAMDPASLVICSEKKVSRIAEKYKEMADMLKRAKGLNEQNQPIEKESKVRNKDDAIKAAGGKKGDKQQPVRGKKKPRSTIPMDDVWADAEEDFNEDFGSSYKGYTPGGGKRA